MAQSTIKLSGSSDVANSSFLGSCGLAVELTDVYDCESQYAKLCSYAY